MTRLLCFVKYRDREVVYINPDQVEAVEEERRDVAAITCAKFIYIVHGDLDAVISRIRGETSEGDNRDDS